MEHEINIRNQARALWASRGYAAVGVQEICTQAGITKPTLYHYFGSKLGLLEALLEQDFGQLCGSLEKEGCYTGDVLQSLQGWSSIYIDGAKKRPEFFRLLLGLNYTYPESEEGKASEAYFDRLRASLRNLFAAASKDHGNMKGRENAYTVAFLGLMNAHAALVINRQEKWTTEVSQKTLHHFMHGIFS